MGTTFHDVAYL